VPELRASPSLQEAWKALRKTQRQLKIILETVPALIWQKGLDEKYVTVNKAYCQTFGFSEEAVIGKTDHELSPAEIAGQFVADDRKVLSSGISELGVEEQIKKGSGGQGWNLTN
jgi:PAS domain S-box-containing protein